MKVNEIREMSAEEQNLKIASLKEELFNLRFQHATGQLENPMRIKEVKKTIARIKTIQREQELKQHELYKKQVKRTVKFKAHDENNEAHTGDKVSIMETRPLSKDKRWRLVEIVEKAK